MLKPLPLPLPRSLPPLPVPPVLPRAMPPLPLPVPPAGNVITSKPGQQSFRATTDAPRATVVGADWVQVTLRAADDTFARVELVAAGVPLMAGSLIPERGTIHLLRSTDGLHCVYRWRG